MKVEPIEYLVTFEDGQNWLIHKGGDDRFRVFTNEYIRYDEQQNLVFHEDISYETVEAAAEMLKKWKETQDAHT